MFSSVIRFMCVASVLVPLSAVAQDQLRFDRLFVLGDSLSDGGAYSQAVQAGGRGQLPSIRYRFTTNADDGSSGTWAEELGSLLGIAVHPNVINGVPAATGTPLAKNIALGGTNFAQGGARISNPAGSRHAPLNGITTIPLVTQIDRLLLGHSGFTATDLVVVWGGANDVMAQSEAVGDGSITPQAAAANMGQAADELAGQIDRLHAAGAETVLVITIPDAASTPLGAQQPHPARSLLSGLTGNFNNQLVKNMQGRNVVVVDSGKILDAVRTNPARYGFTAPNAATTPACLLENESDNALICIRGRNTLPDSEQYIFADGLHPTAATHALFAEAALSVLRAAAQTGAIPVATMTALRQQALALESRLTPAVLCESDHKDSGHMDSDHADSGHKGDCQFREAGDIDVFVKGEIGTYSFDAQPIAPGFDNATHSTMIGFDIALPHKASIGLGLGLDEGQVAFDGDRGGFDTRLLFGTLFGQMALSDRFYINGATGSGQITIDTINRRFQLGTATESYSASSDGTYFFARAGGGALIETSDQVTLNPFAHFTHEAVRVDGFTESPGAASLAFGATDYRARRITAGIAASVAPATLPSWTFNIRGSVEHDLSGEGLAVSIGPDPETLGALSVPHGDQSWGYLGLAAMYALSPGTSLEVSGSNSVGLKGSRGLVGGLTFKAAF